MTPLPSHFGRLAACLVIGLPALLSQGVQTGSIRGSVKDSAGNPVAGARVILTLGTGAREAMTDAQGIFRFALIPPGTVKVQATANGFVGQGSEFRVGIDKVSAMDFVLRPIQTAGTEVIVVANASRIDTTDAKSGENLALETINNLPINNRDIVTIASLAPGTSNDGNGISIRGSQATQVQYLVDGADVADQIIGGPSIRLNEELIEEVQVVTGAASAEYGRSNGGVINTVTKSGTNEFRGSVRFDVTNPAWNAYNPMQRGRDGKTTFKSGHSTIQNYMFSGPIVKDSLFFLVGYRTNSPSVSANLQTTSATYSVPYVRSQTEDRKDIKLDWIPAAGHRLYGQMNETKLNIYNLDYGFWGNTTSLDTLANDFRTYSYRVFGYQGQLSERMLLEASVNHKDAVILGPGSGGRGGRVKPLWVDLQTLDSFDNGCFGDSGDKRPIDTANVHLSYFADWHGSHEIKVGYQDYRAEHASANPQTPSDYVIIFWGFKNATDGTSVPNRNLIVNNPNVTWLWHWDPLYGAVTKNRTRSYFINDRWKLDDQWSFNLGLRRDLISSSDNRGRLNYELPVLSPRLSASWDVKGNRQHILMASYSVNTGQLTQSASDVSSPGSGMPRQRMYTYVGGNAVNSDGSLNRAAFNQTPFFFEGDNAAQIDPNLKMPKTLEYQLSYKADSGKGTTFSLSVVKRVYKDNVDDYKLVDETLPIQDRQLVTRIQNDPNMKRDYEGLELMLDQRVTESLTTGFNVTLSRTRGNYEGGQIGTQDQRNNYGLHISNDVLAPYGPLTSDRPVIARAWANYQHKVGPGTFLASALATYLSGAPYQLVDGQTPTGLGYPWGNTYAKYYTGRGALRFPNSYQCDLQLQYQLPLPKGLLSFARLNITNVFNHQIKTGWDTTVNHDPNNPDAYVQGPYFGKPVGPGNFLAARTLNFACGLRF